VPRVALIHAVAHSIAPVNDELVRVWPSCRRMNILDDSLSSDLAQSSTGLDDAFHARFLRLAEYAVSNGADGLLFSCSAFGPCIDTVARHYAALPVLKPNEAMIAEATSRGHRIGLVATFRPTLESMPAEFPAGTDLRLGLASNAMAALNDGDLARHHALIAECAQQLVDEGCDLIALAQFSMTAAQPVVAARCGVPVLTTVGSAVRALRARFASD